MQLRAVVAMNKPSPDETLAGLAWIQAKMSGDEEAARAVASDRTPDVLLSLMCHMAYDLFRATNPDAEGISAQDGIVGVMAIFIASGREKVVEWMAEHGNEVVPNSEGDR